MRTGKWKQGPPVGSTFVLRMTFTGTGGGYLCVFEPKESETETEIIVCAGVAPGNFISTPFSGQVVVLFRRQPRQRQQRQRWQRQRRRRKSRNLLLAITHTLVTLFSKLTHIEVPGSLLVKVLRTQASGKAGQCTRRNQCATAVILATHQKRSTFPCVVADFFPGKYSAEIGAAHCPDFWRKTADKHETVN